MKVGSSRPSEALVAGLLKDKNLGVKYDIGCGANKVQGFIGIDARPLPGVDIVFDLEKFPWPLPSESASTVVSSHVLEHINPAKVSAQTVGLLNLLQDKKLITEKEVKEYVGEYDFESTFIRFMDEVWRILKPDGEFAFAVPFAGTIGYWQDPTHINGISNATIYYFDPFHQSRLYSIYRPKPWEIVHEFWDTEAIMEIHLRKRREDKSFMTHVELKGKKPTS